MDIKLSKEYEIIKSHYEDKVKEHVSALDSFDQKIANKKNEIATLKEELNNTYAGNRISKEIQENRNRLFIKRNQLNGELKVLETERRDVNVSDDDIADVMNKMNLQNL